MITDFIFQRFVEFPERLSGKKDGFDVDITYKLSSAVAGKVRGGIPFSPDKKRLVSVIRFKERQQKNTCPEDKTERKPEAAGGCYGTRHHAETRLALHAGLATMR